MMIEITAPIFVVGVPRSGTTLLQSLLSAHPDTYSLPETHFFSTVLPRLGISATDQLDETTLGRALDLLHALMDAQFSADQQKALCALAAQRRLTAKNLFDSVLNSYRPCGNCGLRVVEKTPLHAEHLPEIISVYPDAKIIHIVRDPRNAISSLLQTDFAPTRWLLWYTQYWNYVIALTEPFSRQYPDAILTVRYETLVDRAEETLHVICEFAGLRYDESMVKSFALEQRRNVLTAREPWKKQHKESRIYHEPEIWAQRLSPREAWLIETFTDRNMAKFHYQRNVKPAWRDRAAILWRSVRQPHYDRQAAQMGHYLISQCADQRMATHAWLLAVCIALNDWNRLRDPIFRRILSGRNP